MSIHKRQKKSTFKLECFVEQKWTKKRISIQQIRFQIVVIVRVLESVACENHSKANNDNHRYNLFHRYHHHKELEEIEPRQQRDNL